METLPSGTSSRPTSSARPEPLQVGISPPSSAPKASSARTTPLLTQRTRRGPPSPHSPLSAGQPVVSPASSEASASSASASYIAPFSPIRFAPAPLSNMNTENPAPSVFVLTNFLPPEAIGKALRRRKTEEEEDEEDEEDDSDGENDSPGDDGDAESVVASLDDNASSASVDDNATVTSLTPSTASSVEIPNDMDVYSSSTMASLEILSHMSRRMSSSEGHSQQYFSQAMQKHLEEEKVAETCAPPDVQKSAQAAASFAEDLLVRHAHSIFGKRLHKSFDDGNDNALDWREAILKDMKAGKGGKFAIEEDLGDLPPMPVALPKGELREATAPRRRHVLEKDVLKELEKKGENEGKKINMHTLRGLGGNVSLFSKAYKQNFVDAPSEIEHPLSYDDLLQSIETKETFSSLQISGISEDVQTAYSSDEDNDDHGVTEPEELRNPLLEQYPARSIVDVTPAQNLNSVHDTTRRASTLLKLASEESPETREKLIQFLQSDESSSVQVSSSPTASDDLSGSPSTVKEVRKNRATKTAKKAIAKVKKVGNLLADAYLLKKIENNGQINALHSSQSLVEFDRLCRNFNEFEASPQKNYIVKSSELFIVPQPLLVSHLWGVESEIDLTGRGFYREYVNAFSETLKSGLRSGVHTIKMSRNRVDNTGASNLFDALLTGRCQLDILELSHNQIGNPPMSSLAAFLELGYLMELRLNDNLLKGSGVEELCRGIKNQMSPALYLLDLSENVLGAVGARAIANLMVDQKSITSLGLAWTELSGAPAAEFLSSLFKNVTLKTLDLSFNTLGGAVEGKDTIPSLAKLFKVNRTLEHVDLSFNHISAEDAKKLQIGSKFNHVLTGLHFNGNEGIIDSRGFIRPHTADQTVSHSLDRGSHARILNFPGKEHITCRSCWMCGRWTEERFEFDVHACKADFDQSPSEGVFLCLSIDTPRFLPLRMKLVSEAEGKWALDRMLPPGVVEYYFLFTRNGVIVREAAENQPTLNKLRNAVRACSTSFGSAINPFAKLAKGGLKTMIATPAGGAGGAAEPFAIPPNLVKIGSLGKLGPSNGMLSALSVKTSEPTPKTASAPSAWKKRFEKAKNNLSEREKAHLKAITISQLYGNDFEGADKYNEEAFDPAAVAGDPLKSMTEEKAKVGKGFNAKATDTAMKEKAAKDVKGKPTTAEKSKMDKDRSVAKPSTPINNSRDKSAPAPVKAKPKQKNPLEPHEAATSHPAEKNSIFKPLVTESRFVCKRALPRLTKPFSDGGDDDDPYGKKGDAWDVSKSSFAGRAAEMESKWYLDEKDGRIRVHERACASDILNGQVDELLKKLKVSEEDLPKCLDALKEWFITMNDVFKAYSTKTDNPMTLSLNTFTEFALDCEIIDHDQCSLSAVDTIFIHANLKQKKPSLAEKQYGAVLLKHTKHLMQRYQFMIAIVRIAFAKNGGVNMQRAPLSEAIHNLFKKYIDPHAQRITGDGWRKRVLYTPQIDSVLTKRADEIKAVYAKWSQTKIPAMFVPKSMLHKGMTCDEFLELFAFQEILDFTVSMREAKIAFVGSMPMMESITLQPHVCLSYYDFAEALARNASIIFDSLSDHESMESHIPHLHKLEGGSISPEHLNSIANILDQFLDDVCIMKQKASSASIDKGAHLVGPAPEVKDKDPKDVSDFESLKELGDSGGERGLKSPQLQKRTILVRKSQPLKIPLPKGTIAEGAGIGSGSGNNSRRPSADLSAISNSLDFQSNLSRPPSEGKAREVLSSPVTDLSQLLNMRKLNRRASGLGGLSASNKSISFKDNSLRSLTSLNDDETPTDEPVFAQSQSQQNAYLERPTSNLAAMIAATLYSEKED